MSIKRPESSEMNTNSPKKDADYSDFMFWRNLVPLFDKNIPNETTTTRNEDDTGMESSTSERDTSVDPVANKTEDSATPQLATLSNLLNSSSLLETPLNRVSIYSSSNNLSSVANHQFGQFQSASSIEQLSNELKQVCHLFMLFFSKK